MYSKGNCRCNCCKSLTLSIALLLVCLLRTVTTIAGEIDPGTAKKVARNFYLSITATGNELIRKEASKAIELELVHQEFWDHIQDTSGSRKSAPYTLYYVFNVPVERGFLIVSGIEQVKPILGYERKGAFQESQQSTEFQAWMEYYRKQIIFILENDPGTDQDILEEWKVLKEESQSEGGDPEEQRQDCMVPPLILTKWSQGCPYNMCCPVDTTCPCERTYAGCAAVAMAQVLNYWEHPGICHGLEEYRDQENTDTNWQIIPGSDYGWIKVDTPSAYNWSIMPDELNESSGKNEIEEVSKLVFHCGVSVHMNYGPEGSSSNGVDILSALTGCFNYSTSLQFLRRKNFTPGVWKNLLKVELDMGRPAIYFGEGEKRGHGFICDGYEQDGYFHFNWGWGGANDGYYYLDALVPGSTCLTDVQRAIIGICPEFQAVDPCDNIIPLKGAGILHSQSFRGGAVGSWSSYPCGWSTPGREQIYSLAAPSTGLFNLVVTSIDNYVDCAWKEKVCETGGWNCIGDICFPGTYGPMSWKEGEIYYLLLDDEDTIASNVEFYIEAELSTGPEQVTRADQLKLVHHLVSHVITIETAQPTIYAVDLYSLNGSILFSEKNMEIPGKIDVTFLPEGVYLLTLSSGDFVTTKKIVKLQ